MKYKLILILFLYSNWAAAQDDSERAKGDLGFGLGLDYGGIGARFSYYTAPKLGVFGGLGYNLNGLGFNVGATWRIAYENNTIPYFSAMYGYNGVIVVKGASQYNGTFYGPSVAFGIEFHSERMPNYFNIEVLLPFRSQDFNDRLDALKKNPAIQFQSQPWPVSISVGYHLVIW